MISIKDRINLLRAMGVSNADLAQYLSVDPATIWHWVTNDSWTEKNENAKGTLIKDLAYSKIRQYIRDYEMIYGETFNVND